MSTHYERVALPLVEEHVSKNASEYKEFEQENQDDEYHLGETTGKHQ